MTASIDLGKTGRVVEKSKAPSQVRLYYIDWIRLLATFGVFIYHASRPFILQDWLIQDQAKSIGLTLFFLVFLGSWGMPLFFLVSGAGSLFALKKRTGQQYAVERIQRLLIPFIVGCIVLSPFQFYIEWIHKGLYQGPFLSFLPELFSERLNRLSQGVSPAMFEALGSHLWFLGFLFSFSLLGLPLFLWLKSNSGSRYLSQAGKLGEKRGGIMLFVIPVVLSRVLLQGTFPGYTDWADFTYMFVFFLLGYLLYADERFVNAIWRDGKLALGAGLFITATIITILALGYGRDWIDSPGTPGFYLAWTLASVNGWCWTIAALSAGMRYMQVKNKWLVFGQEAILPFYVFHQPVIVIIAFYVVQWSSSIFLKWLVIVATSLVITLAIYQFIIRRVPFLRTLFGMKLAVTKKAL